MAKAVLPGSGPRKTILKETPPEPVEEVKVETKVEPVPESEPVKHPRHEYHSWLEKNSFPRPGA